jgi:glycosyltransferase involved in cell wall biosynthesis
MAKARPIKPIVSINLCCYNSERYLRETLQSIIGQTYKDWELVIVNDGSSDSTEAIIHEYQNKGYPIIYQYQDNKGLGASRNEALKLSRGDYIAFIDHDDIWLPEKLEKQIPLFEKSPKYGIVICDTIFFNNNGDIKQLYAKKKPPTGYVFRQLMLRYFISLETVVIQREALDSLDEWFDVRFNMVEEADFLIRIAYKWEVGYVDEPLAKWRMHSASGTFSKKERAIEETKLMFEKFCEEFKGFELEYRNELDNHQLQIELRYAILHWEHGEKVKARKRLKPYVFSSKKCGLIYLLTFFSYSIYRQLYKLRGMDPS